MFASSIGGIISGIGAIGSAVGGIMGNHSAAKEAQANREWQLWMDSTKYQRAAKDLMKAGINPILAGQFGGSVPSGAVAAQSNPFAGMAEAANSAVRLDTVEKQKADVEKEVAQSTIKNLQSQEVKNMADANRANAEFELINQNTTNAATDNLIKSYQLRYISPKQADLLQSQSTAALASAGASSAQAALDKARQALVDLDVNKRSKSKEIEAESEYYRLITEGVSNSGKAFGDVADGLWDWIPWRKGYKKP